LDSNVPDDPDYQCTWYNQWKQVRSQECDTSFEVDFGKNNPPVGAKRKFKLVVSFSSGTATHRIEDTVTITLGETPSQEYLSGDPLDGHGFRGTTVSYSLWGYGENGGQSMLAGRLDDGRWYVQSVAGGEDCMWGYPASVECHQGEHWEVKEDEFTDREGCVGTNDDLGELVVLVSSDGGWVISDRQTYATIATLTPRVTGHWELIRSK
jgi:hypothetical protein